MQCFVYKSLKKCDTYIYITEKDQFEHIPNALTQLLGSVEFVLQFDVFSRSKLGRENIEAVRKNLQEQGFHLQMPENTAEDLLNYHH